MAKRRWIQLSESPDLWLDANELVRLVLKHSKAPQIIGRSHYSLGSSHTMRLFLSFTEGIPDMSFHQRSGSKYTQSVAVLAAPKFLTLQDGTQLLDADLTCNGPITSEAHELMGRLRAALAELLIAESLRNSAVTAALM